MDSDTIFEERIKFAYDGHDIDLQRQDTLRRLSVKPAERVLDLGSGPGILASALARQVGVDGEVIGVDISEHMIERSNWLNNMPWLKFVVGDAESLPFEDAVFDAAISIQLAEYIPDIRSFCSEVFRGVKPNGRVLITATDWDSIVWHSTDPQRMSYVLKVFSSHCTHRNLPRTLAPRLRKAGFQVDNVEFVPVVNVDWQEGNYCQVLATFIENYLRSQSAIPDCILNDRMEDLIMLCHKGQSFFSFGCFKFQATRPN